MLEGSPDEWESWGWTAESPCFAAFTLDGEKRRGGSLWKGQDLREGGRWASHCVSGLEDFVPNTACFTKLLNGTAPESGHLSAI